MKIKEFEQCLNNFLKTLENHGSTADFLFGAGIMANYAVNLLTIHEIVGSTFDEKEAESTDRWCHIDLLED